MQTYFMKRQNKQKYREYLMNRDGFTLLVMVATRARARGETARG